MKARIELTAETVRRAIEEGRPTSMTRLAHGLGYRGSVSSWLAGKLRAIVPDIDVLLKGTAEPANVEAKAAAPEARPAKAPKARPAARDGGKRPRDPRNPFRPTSAYAACFDILAAHPDGMPKDKLVQLLAGATGKDAKHAAFDAQVLLSARGNEPGLSRNDGPRHRSCRPGFWVRRTNGHVQLVVD